MKKNMKNLLMLTAILFLISFAAGCNKKNTAENKKPVQIKTEQTVIDMPKTSETADEKTKQNDTNQDAPNSAGNSQNAKENKTENKFKDIKVKAVYLTGTSAGNKKVIDRIIELSKTTELNSVVIDVKDDYGKVNYQTEAAEAKRIGAFYKLYDPDTLLKTLHDNNIYVIGRIVSFKDPLLGAKRADLAIKRPNGQIYRERGVPWLNPYNADVWNYNIDIAKEAISKGFDEIQFDYVRFPAARKSDVKYGQNPAPKAEAIAGFLKTAYKEIHEGMGASVSADVFGIACESPGDFENIGQDIEKVGIDIDCISPMIYPSHYANKAQNGVGQAINGVVFKAPDLEPYKVVYNSLVKAKNRISNVPGYKAKMRPYLQDFTASWLTKGYYKSYTAEDVRQQIKAVYDAGYDQWILWDPSNTYSEAAFEKKTENTAQ